MVSQMIAVMAIESFTRMGYGERIIYNDLSNRLFLSLFFFERPFSDRKRGIGSNQE